MGDGKKADVLELQLKLDRSEQAKLAVENEAKIMLDEIDQVKDALEASRMKAQRDAQLIEEYRTKLALLMR